jgi:hypothetical protein
MDLDFDCWDWKAIQNNLPGPDDQGTLTISGTCGQFPTGGFKLELRPRRGGINPMEPWFELVVIPPEGEVPKVLSDEEVIHTISVDRGQEYTKVTIVYEDQPRWHVDVEQAS